MNNKTFRLFISSTFSDFLEERAVLNKKIFHEIDDYCQRRGYAFQIIDLRWGVNAEATLNQKTIEICLEEVKRCCTLSPRPNFLLMIGERYGWIPLPSKIKKEEYEKLYHGCSDEDKTILDEWYKLDENVIGGEYYLKERMGKYKDDNNWSKTENSLSDILVSAGKRCGFNSNKMLKFTSSATEKEIVEGLLSDNSTASNVIAIFRNGYPDQDADKKKIIDLRNRISQKMTDTQCEDNLFELEYDENYINRFSEKVKELILKNINIEIERLEREKSTCKTYSMIEEMFGNENEFYFRERELSVLTTYVKGDSCRPMVVCGDSGSGKSRLLYEVVKLYESETVYSFFGMDEHSCTVIETIKKLCLDIRKKFDINSDLNVNYSNLTDSFYDSLKMVPQNQKLLVVIDGFDMFYDIEQIREKVIPERLPENIKLIFSFADNKYRQLFPKKSFDYLEITRFNLERSRIVFSEMLKNKNRRIASDYQMNIVESSIANGCTPLQLKLMVDCCMNWRSSDNDIVLYDNSELMAIEYVRSMYKKLGHEKELTLYAMALITLHPYGITEKELQLLLLKFRPVREMFYAEDRYSYEEDRLPFVIWSRLFYDLKRSLTISFSNGSMVIKCVHNIFNTAFKKHYADYCNEAYEVITDYYLFSENYTNQDKKIANTRKALSVIPLLVSGNRKQELTRFLSDVYFVDIVVKSGGMDNLIVHLGELVSADIDIKTKNTINKIYDCLVKNYLSLSCYKNGFLDFCAECEIISDHIPVIFQDMQSDLKDNNIIFPYSTNSIIAWSDDSEMYAVVSVPYICICESKNNLEIFRIYIEQIKNYSTVKSVLWLGKDEIAVIIENGVILIYRINQSEYNFVGELEGSNVCSTIRYCAKKHILYYVKKTGLCAYSISSGYELFNINFKVCEGLVFNLCNDGLYLTVYHNSFSFNIYDAETGELEKKVSLPSKHLYFDYSGKKSKRVLEQINDNKWLLISNQNTRFEICDYKERKRVYFNPPVQVRMQDILYANPYLVLVYDNLLLLIDFNNYFISYYEIANINSVSWAKIGETLSVLAYTGLYNVCIDDFNNNEKLKCYIYKRNLFNTTRSAMKRVTKALNGLLPLIKYFFVFHRYAYSYSVFDMLSKLKSISNAFFEKGKIYATLIVWANDGKCAVAYESKDTIVVFDENKEQKLVIDKLKLALNNNILKLEFSPDSKYLLIHMNSTVFVINADNGKCIIKLNTAYRPVNKVYFTADSKQLVLILCNNTEYIYDLCVNSASCRKQIPDKLDFDANDYFGVYQVYEEDDSPKILRLFEINFNYGYLSKSFVHNRFYYGKKDTILFKDGLFFLCGNGLKQFDSCNNDFSESLHIEQQRDKSNLASFLREKNDLSSVLTESGDERYLVLICKLLNSVIVFDKINMEIVTAYKHHGNIIGCKVDKNHKTIELLSDCEPFELCINISLL